MRSNKEGTIIPQDRAAGYAEATPEAPLVLEHARADEQLHREWLSHADPGSCRNDVGRFNAEGPDGREPEPGDPAGDANVT